jgi:hypothetical protein
VRKGHATAFLGYGPPAEGRLDGARAIFNELPLRRDMEQEPAASQETGSGIPQSARRKVFRNASKKGHPYHSQVSTAQVVGSTQPSGHRIGFGSRTRRSAGLCRFARLSRLLR